MINVYDDILLHPDYFKQLAVKESLLVNYQCPQMEEWIDLFSHMNHIIYTVSGKKILNTPGQTHILTEGSLYFLKKGAVRQGKFFDSNWVVIVFCMPDSYLKQLLKEYRLQVGLGSIQSTQQNSVMEIASSEITRSYFRSLLPYFTQQPPAPESLLELKCRELIFSIFSTPGNAVLLSYLTSVIDCSKPLLTEIMEANFRYNLSLEQFAKISQRSLTAFKAEFIRTFNTTPGKWLLLKRLDYARMLLSVSQKNINEIVYECGFESTTHFSRVFKEKFGAGPLQFRKRLIKAQ